MPADEDELLELAHNIEKGVPVATPVFDGATEEEIMRYWCAKAGIAYLGRADIGHDVENKVVPFGALKR